MKIQVKDLAAEARADITDVILTLIYAGISVENPDDYIPNNKIREAREALKIPQQLSKKDLSEVTNLALKEGLEENIVRDLLINAKILRKRRLKRIPNPLIGKAIITLKIYKGEEEVRDAIKLKDQIKIEKREAKQLRKTWPIIGREQTLKFIAVEEICYIHWELVKEYETTKDPIFPPGVKSDTLLESAAFRPHTSLGKTSKYPTIAMAAASLLHAIILDHPFHNGNKRTAFVSMLTFLEKNGWVFNLETEEVYKILLKLADHKLVNEKKGIVTGTDEETIIIAKWVQQNIRQVQVREHPLKFRQLRSILKYYKCKIEEPGGAGSGINIIRGKKKVSIGYHNEGTDVSKERIHFIRRELGLDEEHGYDSDIFYSSGPKIPDFINNNRKLLNKLAKV
jgi:death-on-curing family protein